MERRHQPRLAEVNSVGVTIRLAPDAPDLEKKTFFCRTQDISADGLRFFSPTPVPVGARLEMRLAFAHPLRAFRHVGTVAWTQPVGEDEGDPGVRVGVRFSDSPTDGWIAWKDNVARRIAARVGPDGGKRLP